jgi:hypothetical protein
MSLPDLSHITTLDQLYIILQSGTLISRSKSGAPRGLSSETQGNPNYVYLAKNTESAPLLGKAKIILSPQILLDRKDYILNTDWFYGPSEKSLPPSKLFTWLQTVQGPGEILFLDDVNINPYLKEIQIPQLPPYLVQMIQKSNKHTPIPILNLSMIPSVYHPFIRII